MLSCYCVLRLCFLRCLCRVVTLLFRLLSSFFSKNVNEVWQIYRELCKSLVKIHWAINSIWTSHITSHIISHIIKIKKQDLIVFRVYFSLIYMVPEAKGPYSQSCSSSSSHVWIWELDHKEGWVPKNWCFQIVVLEKTLESPLDYKGIKSVNPKGNQFWIVIRRTGAEAEALILWPPDAKNWLIGKDPKAGKDWRQEEKGTTGDEMVGWHHQYDGHEFEQAPGVGNGQGSLVCFSPWGRKESDMTELLNWTEYCTVITII